MKTLFHGASNRGYNDIGWLKANFSFSFGPFQDERKMNFGVLRVLNDDFIARENGFRTTRETTR